MRKKLKGLRWKQRGHRCKFICWKKDSEGFTLIETLIALFILMFACSFFTDMVYVSTKLTKHNENASQIDWHVFMVQLENETKDAEFIEVAQEDQKDVIHLKEQSNLIKVNVKIEKYNDMIRKKKNNGHHPLLMNVKEWKVTEQDNKLKVNVMLPDEKCYQGQICFEKQEE